jgi:PHYB activation tagged suppressor 1
MVKRAKNTSYGNDLLGLMFSATIEKTTIKGGKVHFGMQPLMDNCKTFFITRHETTCFTWVMMVLAPHTTWQECVREERICGHDDHPIDPNVFNKLKTIL